MKIIATRILAATAIHFITSSCQASTWNFVWVGNDETRFFFDADTVEKSKDITTVWIKTVQVNHPNSNGSWSYAHRWKINCQKKTIQTLAYSSYDKDGRFIRSDSTPGTEDVAVPDSTGEAMMKIACEANFPRDTSNAKYFKLEGNDVYQATKNYGDYQKSQIDSAPK